MSSSLPAASEQPSKSTWCSLVPYMVPPAAACLAIVLPFRDLMIKSAQQQGSPMPRITFKAGIQAGLKATPTLGVLVGSQMMLQNAVEKILIGESNSKSLSTMLMSSAIVGITSSPVVAVFNAQAAKISILESLRKLSLKQGMVIVVQETAFVAGLSAAGQLAAVMKNKLGDNKVVDCAAAFAAGAAGSLAGHPANTALTRWQSGLKIDNLRQLMWGSMRKARAVGLFSVIYGQSKGLLNSATQCSHKPKT